MTRRRLVLSALLLAGVGGGFVGSLAIAGGSSSSGTAAPVAAQSPSLPVDPVPELLPDPTTAALSPGIRLVRQQVGAGDVRMTVPVPRGWRFSVSSLHEWQWRPPDQPDFGYVLRVEQVLSNRRSIDWTLDRRVDELAEDGGDATILGRGADSLHFSHVTSNHLRHVHVRWRDLTGSDNAQVEIAVTGRQVDDPGMADLIARVAAGVELARPGAEAGAG